MQITYEKQTLDNGLDVIVHEDHSCPIVGEPHRVPSGYYKIVYDANGNAAGFIMQQSAGRQDNFCTKQKTVAEIQAKLTTYTLPSLADSTAIAQRLGC